MGLKELVHEHHLLPPGVDHGAPPVLPASQPTVLSAGHVAFPSPTSYLDGGHPGLPPDEDPAVLQRGHVGFLQLHEGGHQVGDVHLPVGTEQEAGLCPRAGALGHKLGEDPHGGVLVQQGAAPAPPLLLVFVLAVSRGPVGKDMTLSGLGNGLREGPRSPGSQVGAAPVSCRGLGTAGVCRASDGSFPQTRADRDGSASLSEALCTVSSSATGSCLRCNLNG